MGAQTATLIAALTSVVTLGLNTRLAILKEKRLQLWQQELERLIDLGEISGVAQELALNYASPEILDKEFPPLHDKLRNSAGRFGRYPKTLHSNSRVKSCLRCHSGRKGKIW